MKLKRSVSRRQRQSRQHNLTDSIAKLRKSIRKKYRKFKSGEVEFDKDLEKQYKPIITELKKTETSAEKIKEERQTKREKEEYDYSVLRGGEDNFQPKAFSSPGGEKTVVQPSFLDDEEVFGDNTPITEDVSAILSTLEGQESASRYINANFKNDITKRYMSLVMGGITDGRSDQIDHVYGPRFDGSVLKIGDKLLQFDEDGQIRIDDRTYGDSEGLYELIFMKTPDRTLYDEQDLLRYKDILIRTSAHKRNYLYRGNINRNTSHKYKLVIADLFPPSQQQQQQQQQRRKPSSGTGLLTKSLAARDTVYWDDPNELVERLRVLVASAEAGNNGVKNEILNILEELREAGLISGTGNAHFKALLK